MGTEGTHLYGDRAPHNLQYVVLVASSNLTQERVLTGTSNQITVTDNGAGSTVVLSTPQDIHTGATPTFAGITLTAAANISFTNTVAAGESLIDCHIIQGDDDALTGTLRGAYITASNGDEVATGTIRGVEIKARAGYPGETGANVNVLEGFSISSDAKTYDVTTHRGGEIILDGGAGTSTLAVGLRIANNFQANRATTSYGLQIYRDSFDYTADIQMSSGGLIGGSGGDLFITDAGYVGIGTAAPDSLTHIVGTTAGDGGTNNGSGSILHLKQNATWTASQEWALFVEGYSYLNGFRINAADNQRALHKVVAGGQLGFSTTGDDPITFTQVLTAERMRIAAGGNVGIGTAAPGSKLHVQAVDSVTTPQIIFGADSNEGRTGIGWTFDGNWAGKMFLYTRGVGAAGYDGTWNIGLTQDDDGKIGIGTTSPAGQLHIDQSSTTAAIPVLILDQADVSEEMIEFVSTIGVGNALEAVGGKTLTTTHFIKVTLPGALTRYIPVGTIA